MGFDSILLANTDETIVAIASAHGFAARGIVRLSGPDVWRLAGEIFRDAHGVSPEDWPPFTCRPGLICLPEIGSVPAECYVFRAPASYTRQDSIELHTVGSPPLLGMIVHALNKLGARNAQPGEFTARAFLAGAIDLSQAESVAATIRAQSDAELRAAQTLRDGALDQTIRVLGDRLTDLLSLVEADIDFAEEPIQFIATDSLIHELASLGDDLTRIVSNALDVERFGAAPCVLLIGAPNAGKSTLMNRLSGLDRSACSPLPGATRDVLSAPIKLPRGEAILLDAAGLPDEAVLAVMQDFAADAIALAALDRPTSASQENEVDCQSDANHETSPDLASAAAARAAVLRADLVCLVLDAAAQTDLQPTNRLAATYRCVLVLNKIDLLDDEMRSARLADTEQLGAGRPIAISALTGSNVDALRARFDELLFCDEPVGTDRLALSSRQRESLLAAAESVHRAEQCATRSKDMLDVADLVASDLHEARRHLDRVTAEVTTDDLLDRVFSRFCIGK